MPTVRALDDHLAREGYVVLPRLSAQARRQVEAWVTRLRYEVAVERVILADGRSGWLIIRGRRR